MRSLLFVEVRAAHQYPDIRFRFRFKLMIIEKIRRVECGYDRFTVIYIYDEDNNDYDDGLDGLRSQGTILIFVITK